MDRSFTVGSTVTFYHFLRLLYIKKAIVPVHTASESHFKTAIPQEQKQQECFSYLV